MHRALEEPEDPPRDTPLQAALDLSQCLAVGYTERLAESGVMNSVGSKGDSFVTALIAMAVDAGRGQGPMFRLGTDAEGEESPIIGATGSVKFGMTDAEADVGLGRLRATAVLAPGGPYVFRGFHAFGASNVLAASVLVAGIVALARRSEASAQGHGLSLELLDGGSGLGIPYADDEGSLDVAALRDGVRSELETWAARPTLSDARLLLEPGRWLVGPTGAYLCSVARTKRRGERHIAITDGGIHHLPRPRLVGQDHRVRPVGVAATRAADERADVVGPRLPRDRHSVASAETRRSLRCA